MVVTAADNDQAEQPPTSHNQKKYVRGDAHVTRLKHPTSFCERPGWAYGMSRLTYISDANSPSFSSSGIIV